ncbi:MAG: hypothetical protein KatS3mg081_2797 [Gemmatimonadales bacterium]|nr:MAG: hypothetical protein KatS3mg081_2797 [Gemmatimonadales bacterium]
MKRPVRQAAVVLAAVLCGCSEPVVTTIELSPSSVTLDAIGATQQITASPKDQNGNPIDEPVTWSSQDPSVATVNASGLVTAVANGTTRVNASAGGVTASAQVVVAQAAAAVQKTGGDGQTGAVGTTLPAPLEVRVDDRLGNAIAGISVGFSVTAGGGTVANASVTTDSEGKARTTWTLGTVAGSPQTVVASVQGRTASFSATAVAGPADSLVKVSGDNQSAPAGTTLPESLVVRVADRFGNPVAGHTVGFSVASGGGSVSPTSANTDSAGRARTQWTLGTTPGTQTVEAQTAAATKGSPATFTATALVGSVAIYEGDGQTGLVGYAVNIPPAVRVVDAGGQPLAGVTVNFAVTGGGGSVTGATKVTDTAGIARVDKWTLGSSPGTNTLTATVAGGGFAGSPVEFSATGATAAFDIVIRYLGSTPTASVQEAFDSAAVKWERLIFGDLANVVLSNFTFPTGHNCSDIPTLNETVDDVVIYAKIESIDGPGGTLGSAGPCAIRNSSGADPNLPLIGRMRLDSADLAQLETSGHLKDVILHEMGHVLGFGTLWSTFGFLQNPSLPDPPGEDTHFDGPRAIAEFDRMGGTSYTGGAKVPVENEQGGQGTRDAHWRESVFDEELMTGFLDSGRPNPLSRLSVASLWDLGYTVNLDGSDAYTKVFTAPPLAGPGAKLWLGNDAMIAPLVVVDSGGKVLRVIHR